MALKPAFDGMVKKYLSSAWLPSAATVAVFSLLFVNEWRLHIPFLSYLLLFALAACFLGVLVAGVFQLRKGRRGKGIINLLAFPILGVVVLYGVAFIVLNGAIDEMFSERPDNFGKGTVIPPDMGVVEPLDRFDESGEEPVDRLTQDLVAAFETNSVSATSPRVSTDFAILNEFSTTNRSKLIEHLAASPRWFVTEERGKAYAYRRFVVAGRWQNTLNGFFGSHELASDGGGHFQVRIVVGFDGPVFAEPFRKKQTVARVGSGDMEILVLDDKEFGQGKESYFVLTSSKAVVEIFEQSRLDSRQATLLALADLQRELESALTLTNSTFVVDKAASQSSVPEILLEKGMQGGIYHVRAFVNPGEAGRAYIKVFEATKNTPLSSERITPRSISRIGWSSNPKQRFRYQSEITVYEGDWGNFYPGRFELWFIPDSGQPERKLVEQIFRIEGWMR